MFTITALRSCVKKFNVPEIIVKEYKIIIKHILQAAEIRITRL